ncbi:transcription factor p65-like isoform X4 [Zootermopsis nevadensis]|uniref:transcription factor p65-like isoform X4 n=1 Tax=Zootermopsis nevadensis TaxID=136037 RepID=UPI000B8E704D|nr:transcription factor p65-like isoform X4 [Zootermopsis nevadensis]
MTDVSGRLSSVAGMAHGLSGQDSLNISDVIEVIQTTDPGFADVSTLFSETDMESSRKKSVYVKITEQPASKALRFRYECEGRSAGSIPGVNSTPENKTFPTIQIVGYKGPAVVVVSCVTKDTPYRAHPHNLVGKEGCKKGICTTRINNEAMAVSFSNLGIQCVKKKDIEEALKLREEIRVDPFRSGFSHRNQPTSIDLNAVRLCFQVFLEDGERDKFTLPLAPVVSDPIYDKKAMSDLVICKLSDCSCTVAGGKEIILLCEKVTKEDIQLHFYEERDGNILWEGFGDFQPTHVHKQVAISFRTPRYKSLEVEAPIKVNIQLRRPSDGATSEPLPFEYLPLDSDPSVLKRKRHKYGEMGPNTLQQLEDMEKLRIQKMQHAGGSDQGPNIALPHQMLPVIKREPTEAKLPPPYVFQGGSRSPYTAMATPSPQPSISPHSVGRTPSPMDYAGAAPHSYQGLLGSVTYNMPARHTDFMSAGKVTRNVPVDASAGSLGLGHVIHGVSDLSSGGGIGLFDNSSGMSGIVHNGMYAGVDILPGMANGHNSGMCVVPNSVSGMIGMNPLGLGSMGIAQGLGSGAAAVSVNLAPGIGLSGMNVPVTSNMAASQNMGQAMTDNSIFDLDNQQQFSLDSGDLVSMGLIDPHLSENLSSNLTLSENKQPSHQAKDMAEPSENMTDSFTSLTKEISTLNDMCKGSGMRDHHLT